MENLNLFTHFDVGFKLNDMNFIALIKQKIYIKGKRYFFNFFNISTWISLTFRYGFLLSHLYTHSQIQFHFKNPSEKMPISIFNRLFNLYSWYDYNIKTLNILQMYFDILIDLFLFWLPLPTQSLWAIAFSFDVHRMNYILGWCSIIRQIVKVWCVSWNALQRIQPGGVVTSCV